MNMRPVRTMSQLPYCYYEGYLEKRSFKDKKSRKLWTCLCGSTLFFFNDKRDTEYLEKLDLSGLIEITDDTSVDCNLHAARLNLQIKDIHIGFSAPNAEARELWKGLIQSVSELSVSSSLNLMPGQILMLEDVVKKEKERQKNMDMPDCFHPVSRTEAELLLERDASRGNLLLRPSSYGCAFAISTREELNGPIYKHYQVSRNPDDSFTINLDKPVTCASLPDIVRYFVDTTDGALNSLSREETYEQNISFVDVDNENGERTVRDAAVDVTMLDLPTKPAMTKALSQEEENTYVNNSEQRIFTDRRSSEPEIKAQVKSKKAPIPARRKNPPSSQVSVTGSTHSKETKMRSHMDHLGQTISELKQKFEDKRTRFAD
ncbi:signal-transducing adaptor protein 1-like [Entelurus aequoreus]|uniref:signal-transducing adaptor protein 1-like n=1 Tax=Entelurus aequoreus TaxID=161455 RepID=UPI002B1E3A54|nr:signal-transducing adaptor protein 1-like [Entelurus aequoreus]XP_061895023.1 signal-transducing adaptor protein 1-like [Entelurus aequoreus]XP_061895024.1 signal-transducing adaptor protein 1-like [Entelurus aequoreus]